MNERQDAEDLNPLYDSLFKNLVKLKFFRYCLIF